MSETPSDLNISELTETDIDTLLCLEIENIPEWNRDHYLFEINSGRSLIYKAVIKDEFAGFICVQTIADEIHLNAIGIKNRFRRLGIATQLLDFILDVNKLNKSSVILLEVSEKNLAAISFYEKKEFTVKYYGNSDALLMQKELS